MCAEADGPFTSVRPSARELPEHQRIVDAARQTAPTPFTPATDPWRRTQRSRARAADAGLTFIGPLPEAIALMGEQRQRGSRAMRRRCCGAGRAAKRRLTPTADEEIRRLASASAIRSSSRPLPAAAARACVSWPTPPI